VRLCGGKRRRNYSGIEHDHRSEAAARDTLDKRRTRWAQLYGALLGAQTAAMTTTRLTLTYLSELGIDAKTARVCATVQACDDQGGTLSNSRNKYNRNTVQAHAGAKGKARAGAIVGRIRSS
jgi:hypothetical protein